MMNSMDLLSSTFINSVKKQTTLYTKTENLSIFLVSWKFQYIPDIINIPFLLDGVQNSDLIVIGL